jgi:hypothetical protein
MRRMRYIGKDFPNLSGKTALIEPWTEQTGWIKAQFDDKELTITRGEHVYLTAYGWYGFPETDFEEVTQ